MRTQMIRSLVMSLILSTPYVLGLCTMYAVSSRWISAFSNFYNELQLASGLVSVFEKAVLYTS